MKKVLYFLALFCTVVGILGSIGYMIYYNQYVIAFCDVIVAIVAYPSIKDMFNKLKD